MKLDDTRSASRRRFLRGAGTLAAAAGLSSCARPADPPADAPATASAPPAAPPPAADPPAGKPRTRKLGRTGLEVSVVSFGAGRIDSPRLIQRGLDAGINYLDTSMCYMGGRSEELVGQAIAGRRDEIVLATKWDVFPRHSKADCLGMLDASLKRLGVDAVDVLFLHQVGDHGPDDDGVSRIDHEPLYEAMEQAKADGKAKHFGISSHVGNRAELLRRAMAKDAFDVILVSLSYGNYHGTGVPELIAEAADKDIGVIGMKVSQGNEMPAELASAGLSPFGAQLRWALEQGCQTIINTRITNSAEDQDAALDVARGELKVSAADVELLRRYTQLTSATYCRGCSQHCQGACPEGVRIADVLRYRMYHRTYGDTRQAASRYAALTPSERLAGLCGECNACTAACPHGLPVVELLHDARRLLA